MTYSPRNTLKYEGVNYQFTPGYTHQRDPVSTDIKDPNNQGYYPRPSIWLNKTNKNAWLLAGIANNLASWVLFSQNGSGPLLQFTGGTGTTGFPVNPNTSGQIQYTSTDSSVVITGSASSIDFKVKGTLDNWTDISTNTLATANNGYFCTSSLTLTLPASPSQGNIVGVICDTSAGVTIRANTGQVIRIGRTASSAAGALDNTNQGDSINLVYRAADTTWFAFGSPVGGWNVT